jgi:hypothetical protein
MPLKTTQGTCSFCGESNPVPAGVDVAKIDAQHGPSPVENKPAATQQRDPICPSCGKDNSMIPNARFCFSCGTTLQPRRQGNVDAVEGASTRRCPHCGKDLTGMPKAGKFCLFCGKPVAAQVPTSTTVPQSGGTIDEHARTPSRKLVPLHAVQATPTLSEAIASAQETSPPPEISSVPRAQPVATAAKPAKPRATTPIPAQPRASTPIPAQLVVERVDMLNIACQYDAPVLSASFSKDGSKFFVGTARNEFIARETTNARARRTIPGEQTGREITVLVEPDGKGFATCMSGAVMRFTRVAILETGTGNITSHVKTAQSAILSVAVNSAASMLLLGGYDKNAEIWDLKAGKLLFTLAGHTGAIDAVTLDPTGKLAATGGRDGAVMVWKVETGELLRKLFAHTKPVLCLTFSPDCSRLASGSEDGSIRIWDPEKDSAVSTLTGHRGGVLALAFSKDGKQLVSGGQDTIARVWSTETAKETRTVDKHIGAINAIAISPDGKRVVTGGADKHSYHWPLELEKK